jgi:hypothetical protein
VDLANLKLTLDWVWPTWWAHLAFEQLLGRYARTFEDASLLARMRFYLPLVSLIHLLQFGLGGVEDPENAAAMRAALAVAQRDRIVWSLNGAAQRLWYAVTHPLSSEYAGGPTARDRVRRSLARRLATGKRRLTGGAVRG